MPSATYSVIVVGLTFEGYRNSSQSGGIATSKTITGNDGNTYVINGGSSNRSANTTQAVTLGQTLFATAPIVNGAVSYAWFVGPAGAETLQAISSINSVTFSAPLTSGQQLASSITADNSRNPTLAFDGLLTVGFNPVNGAYVSALASGTAGTGSFLTSSGRGSVVEIDNMLVQMWNTYRLSPTVLYVNPQEQKNITNKCLTSASGPLIRYNVASDSTMGGLTASPPPASYAGITIHSASMAASTFPSRCIPTCRPARSWPTASGCRSGINPTKSPMSPRC